MIGFRELLTSFVLHDFSIISVYINKKRWVEIMHYSFSFRNQFPFRFNNFMEQKSVEYNKCLHISNFILCKISSFQTIRELWNLSRPIETVYFCQYELLKFSFWYYNAEKRFMIIVKYVSNDVVNGLAYASKVKWIIFHFC